MNKRFKAAGKPEVKLVAVPNALEDEDMLEMLNAGLLETIVVDDWKARMWAAYYAKQQGGVARLQREYMSRIKTLKNASAGDDRKRFEQLLDYFRKYGTQYHFDP